ncbi:hypothetical protein LTR95_000955 [Oleoguttula sp. CCFEE 5521]
MKREKQEVQGFLLMPSTNEQDLRDDYEKIPGAKLFKNAGGTKVEGRVKHIMIYDPTVTTNHFEGSDQMVEQKIPQGYYVRIIGPASVKFTEV